VNNLNFQLALGQPQIPIAAFEVVTGSVAYDKPFGPTIFDIAENIPIAGSDVLTLLLNNVGLTNRAAFDSLPRQERDDKFKTLLDTLLAAMGYDATGLGGSGINATLQQGGYVAVHTFGWTEFEIIPDSRVLTITTYGIAPYGVAELNPSITNRTPEIVSQFSVTPILEPIVLNIELLENDLIVSWPAAAKGFVLEQTDSLTSPAQWTSVTAVPSTLGDRIIVRLSESNQSTFYRLRKSQ
jgi:3-phytase/alkaline phosphatase D